MTESQMIEYGRQKRSTSKIYKAETLQITDDAITQTVNRGLAEMLNADRGTKINLSDVEMVKTVSKSYLKACADSPCFPTMAGLARAMGCSRTILYHYMKRKDSETGQWLMMCHDLFSDLLAEAALRNNCNPVVSIFLQKAQFGLSETENVVLLNQIREDDIDNNADSYRKRYNNLIAD